MTVLSTMLVGDVVGLRAGLTPKSAIVGSVGSTFALGEGVRPGVLAK